MTFADKMILYISTREHRYPVDELVVYWCRDLAGTILPVDYGKLFRMKSLPQATYIFSDLERLSTDDLERASRIWRTLSSQASKLRLLNHPLRACRRYELLRQLHQHGTNDFDVYRVVERRQAKRFPVFLRIENGHDGAITDLLYSREELDLATARLVAEHVSRDSLLVTEFCDTRDDRGFYRKYSAFNVGGRIIPRHLHFSRSWQVKRCDFIDDRTLALEMAYLRDNPHRHQLAKIFGDAGIDYGRIDYTLAQDRIQVFEINTNPMSLDYSDTLEPSRKGVQAAFERQFLEALRALDRPASERSRIVVAAPASGAAIRARRLFKALYKRAVLDVFPRIGLRRYQPNALMFLESTIRKAHERAPEARQAAEISLGIEPRPGNPETAAQRPPCPHEERTEVIPR